MTLRRLVPALIALWLAGCSGPAPTTPRPPSTTATAADAATTKPAPAPARVDAAALLSRAESALKAGNLLGGARLLDELLQADPDNRRALGLLATVAPDLASQLQRPQNSPLLLRSAQALRRLRERKVELTPEERALAPVILYNEACTLALNGESTRAVVSLAEAFDAGFARVDLLDSDPDLDPLRRLPEFQALQRAAERRYVEAQFAATKPYPLDFRLPDLDGKPVALADVKGDLTIVDFWGTWCPPCRKLTAHLADLATRDRNRGLRVVGLTYEPAPGDAARQAIRTFVGENKITYPCLLGDAATRAKVPRFQGYPTTLFLDRTGKVRLQTTGYQTMLTLETIVNVLLVESPPGASKKAATH
jgi:thiol-disulfide isomerase/thioredoxin